MFWKKKEKPVEKIVVDDRLQHIGIGGVEKPHSIVFFLCLFEHVIQIYQHSVTPLFSYPVSDVYP